MSFVIMNKYIWTKRNVSCMGKETKIELHFFDGNDYIECTSLKFFLCFMCCDRCCRGLFGLWFYSDLYLSLLLTICYCWCDRCCRGLFGLWFYSDLYHGQTHRCDTYDNDDNFYPIPKTGDGLSNAGSCVRNKTLSNCCWRCEIILLDDIVTVAVLWK